MGISAKEYQRRLQPLLNQSTIQEIVQKIVLSDQKRLKEQKISELTKGERPDGSRIGEYRDAEYGIFKYEINPLASGYVDLLLTRSFTNKMFLKGSDSKFIFDSSDSKTGNLVNKYGPDIMSINQEWFEKRQEEVYRITLVYSIKKDYKIG